MTSVKLRIKDGVKARARYMVPLSEGGPVDRVVFNVITDIMYGREIETGDELATVCRWTDDNEELVVEALDKAGSGFWYLERDQKRLYNVLKEALSEALS